MKPTNIYLTDEQKKFLRKKAFNNQTTMADLVRQAVDEYIAKEKKA